MGRLVGVSTADYFKVKCEECGEQTRNEYLGKDPSMPHFKATCPKCGDLGQFKLHIGLWRGFPAKPE